MNFRKKKKNKDKQNSGDKKKYDVKSIQASMKEELIAVGDAIIAKINTDRNGSESEKDDDNTDRLSKASKRVAESGGFGDFLDKRRKR